MTETVAVAPRIALADVAPEAYQAVIGVENYLRKSVDPTLFELVKLRASIVNGCAFCVDMHSTDALKNGENVRRLFGLAAWHENSWYTAKERAALALTDAVTKLGEHGVPDEVWDEAAAQFTKKELADVLLAIAQINLWNRLAIPSRSQPPA
jgi:AhpD family alkylhydroperoxidase